MGPALSYLSFTYVIIGAVALERGVADDERPRRNADGTTGLKTEVYRGGCPTASHTGAESRFREDSWKQKTRPATRQPLTKIPALLP